MWRIARVGCAPRTKADGARCVPYRVAPLLCLLVSLLVQAEPTAPVAPGYKPLSYAAPQPGTYQLPVLGTAADGKVLNSAGQETRLHALYRDRIVLLSFVYSTCNDVNGCPLATSVLQKIATQWAVAGQSPGVLRLLTLSFNPEHDTPGVMARYGKSFQREGIDWAFLTTRSPAELQPLLRDYQQTVEPEQDEQGKLTGQFSHLLRVILIDRQQRIRNSYTVSVLHPDLVLADIGTLLQEEHAAKTTAVMPSPTVVSPDLLRAGDDKRGYENADYRTHSVALTARQGRPADLLKATQRPPLGLPPMPVPKDNPLTRKKIELGRKLFYDRRLSFNNTVSCAMCHIPEQGFTSQEQATAVGIEGRTVRRNAPTIYNVAYLEKLFHDGRESSLENQVWGPFLASNEMGNPSVGAVVDKIRALRDYQGLFEQVFHRGPSMESVSQAIASYERALISADSPFDRWYYGKQKEAMSEAAQRGFQLFTGKAGCSGCHAIGKQNALFTDQQLHNTGLGFRDSMTKTPTKSRVQLAPGLSVDMDATAMAQVGESKPSDLGRYEITQNPAERWQYRTPSLRNIALTAPYMHNGSMRTLREVLKFYNRGGELNENLDPAIRPLRLSDLELADLLALLENLTGSNVPALVMDAYAAPVGDAR